MTRKVTILGAGLVGSLLSIILRKRGYEVTLFEKRGDIRKLTISAGKSINLATSTRGWKALEIAGLKHEIMEIAIPMYGRQLHFLNGDNAFQPYSKNKEAIYSVSRGELNRKLLTLAEQEGVNIYFNHPCTHVDVLNNTITLQLPDGVVKTVETDLLFGADGAFSALRDSYSHLNRVNSDTLYLDYGYKELTIMPNSNNDWVVEKNALHIWPRGNFMLIALPNTDRTFTCTLFLPFEGEISFESLRTEKAVDEFFETYFTDAKKLIPDLQKDFFRNPTSSLATKHISMWHYMDKSALIGDAAHAIVPFYGQGMNAGFEDCSILHTLLNKYDSDWGKILSEYEMLRKENGDAVGKLALHNFIEMRDKVKDPIFLERKQVEKELGKRYPVQFVSVYEMVSFTNIPYKTALACIAAQDKLIDRIIIEGDFFDNIKHNTFEMALDKWITEYHDAVQQLDFGNEA